MALTLAGTAQAASPHTAARKLLLTCEKAVNSVPIVGLEANTPQVPKANRQAQSAFYKCGTDMPWLKVMPKNGKDKAMNDAYSAWRSLTIGIGDYMTYCGNVAFGHTGTGILHRAQHEIAAGRKLAKKALAGL